MNLARLERGSVVLVAFPFTDLTSTKVRPALVLSSQRFHKVQGDVILATISSTAKARGRGEPTKVVLSHDSAGFDASGLRTRSAIHCGKIVTLRGLLVLKFLGRLDASAMGKVDQALARAVGPRL